MWYFLHPETTIPLEEPADPRGEPFLQENCRLRMRKKPHFLKNIPISRQIRLVSWGRKWQFSFAETMTKNRKSAKFERIFPKKKSHFQPQKTSRIQREFELFFKKCGTFLIRSRQFSCRNDYLGDQLAALGELQPADEENTTFFEKSPDFLVKLDFKNWLKIH